MVNIDALAPVRISSILARPAALLLLGASTVFGCSVANALTFNWSLFGTLNSNNFASGTFDIAETSVTVGSLYVVTGISGTYNGESILGLSSASVNSVAPDNIFQYQGEGSPLYVNGNGIGFRIATFNVRMYDRDLLSGSSTYAVADRTTRQNISTNAISNQGITLSSVSQVAAPVPGPLPILGLPAVLFYSRKLKKRIKESRKLSSASLT
jgi:hypothetical protein